MKNIIVIIGLILFISGCQSNEVKKTGRKVATAVTAYSITDPVSATIITAVDNLAEFVFEDDQQREDIATTEQAFVNIFKDASNSFLYLGVLYLVIHYLLVPICRTYFCNRKNGIFAKKKKASQEKRDTS